MFLIEAKTTHPNFSNHVSYILKKRMISMNAQTDLQNLAFSAMRNSAQLGIIATFCKEAMLADKDEAFIQLILHALNQLDASGTLFLSNRSHHDFGGGLSHPLCKELINEWHQKEKCSYTVFLSGDF